jgi:hypothetical protein
MVMDRRGLVAPVRTGVLEVGDEFPLLGVHVDEESLRPVNVSRNSVMW